MSQSYYGISKNPRQNLTHCFMIKAPHRHVLQKIAHNNSSDIGLKEFKETHNHFTKELNPIKIKI